MWDRKQILVEIRAYTSDQGDTDSNASVVQAYVTRSVIKDRKYQASLCKENINPDPTEVTGDSELIDDNLTNGLADINLNADNLTGEEEEGEIINSDVCAIDGEVDNAGPQTVDSLIAGGEEGFDADLMESMGLPVTFGSKRGKSRKEQRLTEKQIRKKFTETWETHGELMVYKSFVSIYPDYANIYDQVTGSIPPCGEVEVTSSGDKADQQFVLEDDSKNSQIDEMVEEIYDSLNQSGGEISRESGNLVEGEERYKVVTNGSVCVVENRDSCSIDGSGDISEKKENTDLINNGDFCSMEEIRDVCVKKENGDSCSIDASGDLSVKKENKDFMDNDNSCSMDEIKDDCVKKENGDSGLFVKNGDSIILNNREEIIVDSIKLSEPQSIAQSDHLYSFNTEHCYGSAPLSTDENQTKKHETEFVVGDGSQECYSHEELITILRDTHQDLENQIYWHAKETISEWYRKHPCVEFDISSLDDDLMAITQPYLEPEEGEVVEGYHLGDEDEEYYDDYGQDWDEDLYEEDGTSKDVSVTDTLELCGLAVQKDLTLSQRKRKLVHATVTYKRKNIAQEAKRLHLDLDIKPKHQFFDEDGEIIEDDDEKNKKNLENQDQEQSCSPNLENCEERESSLVVSPETESETKALQEKESGDRLVEETDSGSEPDEVPITHTAAAISRSKSLSNLSEDVAEFSPLSSAKSCDDSLSTWTGEQKIKRKSLTAKEKEDNKLLDSVEVRKKRKKRKRKARYGENSEEDHPARNDPQTSKYWYQRYLLFSRFDQGIQMDAESWYSVTPEAIAAHQAKRCQGRYVLDGFCGAGGNVIQFAMFGCKVVAIDIDEEKIKMAQHNASVYGVQDKIEFVVGDFMEVAPKYAGIVDTVFLSPPWGGPDYIKQEVYDAENMNATKLLEVSRQVTDNIALFLPKNSCATQIITLAGAGNQVEIEQNFLESKVKAITAYFGDLVMSEGKS